MSVKLIQWYICNGLFVDCPYSASCRTNEIHHGPKKKKVTMFPTYRYQRNDNDNDNTRGRHLVAARCIDKNELILIERPLVSLQSLENLHSSTLVCRYCRAHCGQPTDSLQLVSQCQTRCQIVMKNHNRNNNKNEQPHDSDNNNNNNNNDTLVSCPQNCGEIYCSRACQQDHWPVHRLLCTGTIPQKEEDDDDNHYDPLQHPLLEFKSHAIQTNEIFLLVADVVCGLLAFSHEKDHVQQVLDFTQTPWWDIVAQAQPQQLQSLSSKDDEEDEDEATTLQDTLRTMCTDAAELLRQHVTNLGIIDDDDNNNNNACNSYLTAQFFGQYIGALEQNAIGIRKRSPLCRQIIMDGQFRTQNHAVLLHCLEHAGMIGSGGECDDDEEECIDEEEEDPQAEQQQQQQEEHVDNTNQQETTEWDYSVPEIASFLAGLDMDELDNGGGGGGDDWDTIFPPLDGTAMYSMTCKMNHSCDPNVVVLYRSHHHHQDWSSSSREPLVLHSVAIRDIAVGEELCISYIDTSRSVEERQQELRDNYGFHCRCRKCVAEEDSNNSNNNTDNLTTNQDKQEKGEANAMDDLFGEDDDDDSNGDEKAEEEEDGETLLARRLTELNTAANQSTVGAVPIKILGGVFGLVVQKGTAVQSQAQQVYPQHVLDCLQAVRERDFCLCQSAGMALEAALYQDLVREGGFPTSAHREAYICGAVVAAVGHAHLGSFLSALVMLDKAMILGLPRRATAVPEFVDYVEHFANATAKTPLPPSVSAIIGCYDKTTRLSERGLSKPIEFPVDEKHMDAMLPDSFAPEFVAKERCVVLRGFAKSWPAIDKWR